ncbi:MULTISPECIES: portal protein [unclassified Mesorhizobium]|uniref:portal protein n=1 Tax=unclassified Mesorhizobium TaxID=325217 RepID=UPI000FCBB1A1|nr:MULTISPECIES: portal protein [unclassified Mesorhizobium]RUT86781.1 phage tail protein [Mesorhizobium sp. M7A.T.Ca.US.000.02.2.1]RUT87626.1 phage tail protein [Mesorhizobium sp. M7A.T.Ca.US.000.02.1.1]
MAGAAASRYGTLESQRKAYLDRARVCAKLTIPTLLPDEGANGSTSFTTPEQSLGARGINNVAAKMLLALFPPNAPFFKMEVDDMTAAEISGQEGAKDEVDKAFGQFVRRVMTDVEGRALRSDLYEALRLLVVSGNVLVYITEEGRCRVYRMDKYVVKRDPAGNLLEVVIKESIALAAIPEDVKKEIPTQALPPAAPLENGVQTAPSEKPFFLFTHVVLNDEGQYQVYQEVEGVVIPGSEGTYLREELPFLALRYNKVDGEDYGRGLVEEYLGDLLHLESLSKSIREFVAISSRVIPMVNPNGSTSVRDLMNAANGEPIAGNAEDITFLQIERYNDFRVAKEMITTLEQRMAFAFLLNTAIQRPGERVTAEEIRYMARELEDTLGGTYSVQAVDLQLPLATVLIKCLERRGSLPELPHGIVFPKVVTGMDALGRGNDLSNLIQFKAIIQETPAVQTIKWDGFAQRVANSLNVETAGLIMTAEESQAAQQQAMMQQLVDKLGPNAVNQLGGMAQKSMETPTA